VKVWPDGLCSFCGITLQKRMNVAGLDLVYKSRYDQVNPYRDTMRAIEFMAQSPKERGRGLKTSDLQRWANQAWHTLPDRNFKYNPDLPYQKEIPPVTQGQQREAREAEGVMKELWNNAVYERKVLKRKPVNEIQKQNYDAVDKWTDNG
jgi:hypothetical protein